VPGARLLDNRACLGALLAAGAPPGALALCQGADGSPPLLALLPAEYPASPALAVVDAAAPRFLSAASVTFRAALAGGAPAASLAQLSAAWQRHHAALRGAVS